jgi:hypothetical protein
VIVTDGEENSSCRRSQKQIGYMNQARKETGLWNFVWITLGGKQTNHVAREWGIECLDFKREELDCALAGAADRIGRLAAEIGASSRVKHIAAPEEGSHAG